MTHDKDCSINLDASPRFDCDCSQKTPMTEPQKMGVEEVMGLIQSFEDKLHKYWSRTERGTDRCWDDAQALRGSIESALTTLIADRDALALRVTELEGAITATFGKQISAGWWQCIHCLQSRHNAVPYNPEPFPHAPDCIVRTINPQP